MRVRAEAEQIRRRVWHGMTNYRRTCLWLKKSKASYANALRKQLIGITPRAQFAWRRTAPQNLFRGGAGYAGRLPDRIRVSESDRPTNDRSRLVFLPSRRCTPCARGDKIGIPLVRNASVVEFKAGR